MVFILCYTIWRAISRRISFQILWKSLKYRPRRRPRRLPRRAEKRDRWIEMAIKGNRPQHNRLEYYYYYYYYYINNLRWRFLITLMIDIDYYRSTAFAAHKYNARKVFQANFTEYSWGRYCQIHVHFLIWITSLCCEGCPRLKYRRIGTVFDLIIITGQSYHTVLFKTNWCIF